MIRHAVPEDARSIAEVQICSWRAAYAGMVPADHLSGMLLEEHTEFWERLINENRNPVLVVEKGGRVVGWISGGESRDAEAQGVAEVYAIYLLPEFQRQGTGRALMQAVEPVIAGHGAGITLWVFAENHASQAFYRNVGYEPDGTRQIFQIGGASMEELRFRKRLLTDPAVSP